MVEWRVHRHRPQIRGVAGWSGPPKPLWKGCRLLKWPISGQPSHFAHLFHRFFHKSSRLARQLRRECRHLTDHEQSFCSCTWSPKGKEPVDSIPFPMLAPVFSLTLTEIPLGWRAILCRVLVQLPDPQSCTKGKRACDSSPYRRPALSPKNNSRTCCQA